MVIGIVGRNMEGRRNTRGWVTLSHGYRREDIILQKVLGTISQRLRIFNLIIGITSEEDVRTIILGHQYFTHRQLSIKNKFHQYYLASKLNNLS